MATPRLRAWFLRVTAVNTRGKQTAFKDGDEPNQLEFEDQRESSVFKTEAGDRATTTTGAALESEVGHVSMHTDPEAKAGTSGLKIDRTNATHAGQLPTSEVETQTIGSFTGAALEITADAGTSTRNRYLFKISTLFSTWLLSLKNPLIYSAGQLVGTIGTALIDTYTLPADTVESDYDFIEVDFNGNLVTGSGVDFSATFAGISVFSETGSTAASGFNVKAKVRLFRDPSGDFIYDYVVNIQELATETKSYIGSGLLSSADFTANNDVVFTLQDGVEVLQNPVRESLTVRKYWI